MSNEIPQSSALKEASETDSLAEVMSRDPEGLSRQDRARIVESLRLNRERLQKAAASGEKVRGPGSAAKVPLTSVATKPLSEMDL